MTAMHGFPLADHALLALMAITANVALGGPGAFYRGLGLHRPTQWLKQSVLWLESRLNREKRGQKQRFIRGGLLLAFFGGAALAAGAIIAYGSRHWDYGYYLEILALALLLPARPLLERGWLTLKALRGGNNALAMACVYPLARRDREVTDAHGVARCMIEGLAEHLSDRVIGPLFWYLILGLPGFMLSRMVHVLDALIGHASSKHEFFGKSAAWLETALQWLPARITGWLIVLSSLFAPGASPLQSVLIMLRDHGKFRSFNSGWPIAAAAGALGLSLGGPRTSGNAYIADLWVGSGTTKPDLRDLARALYLHAIAILLALAALGLLFLIAGKGR